MGTSIAIKSAAEVDEETGEWKQKTLSAEEKKAMIKRAPGLAKLTAGKSDAEVDAIIAKVRDQMGRKSPRYRCHLGCILLKMPTISSLLTGVRPDACGRDAIGDGGDVSGGGGRGVADPSAS